MGFFDDMDVPADDEFPEEEYSTPEWYEAPRGWLGGVVPVELLVARNETVAVYLTGFVAYPTGFSFQVNTFARSAKAMRGLHRLSTPSWPHDLEDMDLESSGRKLPDAFLRFGLQYSDGRKASTLGQWLGGGESSCYGFTEEDEGPDPEKDIFLTSGGGGGSDTHSRQDYWVWPLPPAGEISFACEWPRFEILETVAQLDGDVIRGAACRAEQVWPD